MAARTRIQIAKSDIFRLFDELPDRVMKQADIAQTLTANRGFWRLAQRTNTTEFIHFLRHAGRLKHYQFRFPSRTAHAYAWGEAPLFEILLSLRPRSYLSHYTAVRIHGLTEQAPRAIYVTHEPTVHPVARERRPLTQEGIDAAFQKPERGTQEVATFNDQRICLINGAGTGMIGVTDTQTQTDSGDSADVRVTNLERTLIDITVRPAYAGGVAEVLEAFREAKARVSSNRLRALLETLNYAYPYHQAIGFYLERAGYSDTAVDLFRQLPRPFRFHLSHGIDSTDFIRAWNLNIPRGL